jgi:peptidoglycan-N-acetylglucosamine deacetylase
VGFMGNRSRVMRKKRFIIFIVVLIASIFALSLIFYELKENIFYIKAETLGSNVENSNDKNNEENDIDFENTEHNDKQKDNVVNDEEVEDGDLNTLDNSGYITLDKDPNADDASIVLPKTMYEWNFYREDGRKIAYLTFDDGPSKHATEKILDILAANNVKATFFTLGSSIEHNNQAADILKRIAREGHSIGSHGYSHDYSILYPNRTVNLDAFINDFEKNDRILKEILGKDFNTRLIRMPGGHASWNGTAALDEVLTKKGIYQTDWNSLNGDAESKDFPTEYLLNKLKETVGDKDVAIVLMHDTDAKKGTVHYLQSAIDYLKSEGFEFRTLK